MARIKIEVPEKFIFSTSIPIRITDVNYGGHVGNDAVLSIIHEIRAQFIQHLGYTELNFGGVGLIMSNVAIEYKQELFYGDIVEASLSINEVSRIGFDITYLLSTTDKKGNLQTAAIAKSGMVSYDYTRKKIVSMPAETRHKLTIG